MILAEEALQLHHGLQADTRASRYQDQADIYLGLGPPWDADQDGIGQELRGAHPAALAAYMSMLSIPSYRPPSSFKMSLRWAEGRRWFEEVGCASCHRPSLRLTESTLTFKYGGKEPGRFEINPLEVGQTPRPHRLDFSTTAQGTIERGVPIFLFSDLKRHDMGEGLAEPRAEVLPDGTGEVEGRLWLTRPLWGLADSAPYLHDGRAQSIDEAISAHGGEATRSRRLYSALDTHAQGSVRLFLMSLSRPATLLVE